eukprot:6191051-Pleurochrysis_carterae.AAC.3
MHVAARSVRLAGLRFLITSRSFDWRIGCCVPVEARTATARTRSAEGQNACTRQAVQLVRNFAWEHAVFAMCAVCAVHTPPAFFGRLVCIASARRVCPRQIMRCWCSGDEASILFDRNDFHIFECLLHRQPSSHPECSKGLQAPLANVSHALDEWTVDGSRLTEPERRRCALAARDRMGTHVAAAKLDGVPCRRVPCRCVPCQYAAARPTRSSARPHRSLASDSVPPRGAPTPHRQTSRTRRASAEAACWPERSPTPKACMMLARSNRAVKRGAFCLGANCCDRPGCCVGMLAT